MSVFCSDCREVVRGAIDQMGLVVEEGGQEGLSSHTAWFELVYLCDNWMLFVCVNRDSIEGRLHDRGYARVQLRWRDLATIRPKHIEWQRERGADLESRIAVEQVVGLIQEALDYHSTLL